MKRWNASVSVILVGLISSFLCPSAAVADQQAEKGSGFTVTPRFWLSSIDPLVGVVAVNEAYPVPTFGATVSYRPQGTSNYSFSLSGLWGKGNGDAVIPGGSLETSMSGVPFYMGSTASVGESEGKRTDIEFMIRRAFPNKRFSVHLGLRWASWRETTTSRIGYTVAVGPILGQTISDEQSADFAADLESDYYGLEIGFGTISQLSGNGRHCLSSDFTIAAARTEWETTLEVSQNLVPATTFLDFLGLPDTKLNGDHFSTALDVAAGYQYRGNRFGCNLGYKILVVFEQNALRIPQLTAVSGPEVGISVIF